MDWWIDWLSATIITASAPVRFKLAPAWTGDMVGKSEFTIRWWKAAPELLGRVGQAIKNIQSGISTSLQHFYLNALCRRIWAFSTCNPLLARSLAHYYPRRVRPRPRCGMVPLLKVSLLRRRDHYYYNCCCCCCCCWQRYSVSWLWNLVSQPASEASAACAWKRSPKNALPACPSFVVFSKIASQFPAF